MSDLFDWIQSYWFELGSLTAQFAMLAAVVKYSKTALRILAASQRQAAPAAQVSETAASFDPAESVPAAYGGVGRMLSPMPSEPVMQEAPIGHLRVERASTWRAMIDWLQAPIGSHRRSVA